MISPTQYPSRRDDLKVSGLPRFDFESSALGGEARGALQKIDLNTYLQERESVFKDFLGPLINLRFALNASLSEIQAHPEALQKLILIILSNAKKAMPQGGQLLLQTREASMPNGEILRHNAVHPYLLLAVSDSGNGIPRGTQIRIQQLLSGRWRPQEGVFAGLTEAKGILQAFQAQLLLYSQMGRGTTVKKVYFPLRKADDQRTLVSKPAKGTETLLFVEDDAMTRHVYVKYLKQRGYNVLEAEHGKKAFDLYENHPQPINLMITDVVMPELNGRQLVDLMSTRHPQLKVLYISGFTKDAIVQRGIIKPDTPFLEKPFGREELALRIRQMLDIPA